MNNTLFTLRQSWHQAPWIFERLCFARAGDSILLLEDAVLALQSPLALGSFLAKCDAQKVAVYALKDDCETRGVNNGYARIELVGYDRFVNLVVAHHRQVSW